MFTIVHFFFISLHVPLHITFYLHCCNFLDHFENLVEAIAIDILINLTCADCEAQAFNLPLRGVVGMCDVVLSSNFDCGCAERRYKPGCSEAWFDARSKSSRCDVKLGCQANCWLREIED